MVKGKVKEDTKADFIDNSVARSQPRSKNLNSGVRTL
jgi:hypothetical protein